MNCGVPGSTATRSNPGGARSRTICMMLSGCLGENKILGAMVISSPRHGSLLSERNRRGDDRHLADDPSGVALAGGVLDESGVPGTEHVLGAVPEPDFELAGQDHDELTARRRMPVEEPPHRPYAKRDLRGRQALEPVGLFLDVDRLDGPLAISPGVEPERSHARPPWRRRRRADASTGGTRRGDRTKVYYLGRNFW